MIKVGETIGDRIYCAFSLNSKREHFRISRQTVFNIIRKSCQLMFYPPKASTNPQSLIIMADEKYIPLQANDGKKQMVKATVIYESSLTKNKRTSLINKHIYLSTNNNFWEELLDIITNKYDYDSIKNIHVLGDGASWIKSALTDLKSSRNTIDFSLDKFHYRQAIHRITNNKALKD